jgi:cyclopropane-fatty-acyl-phospholipid synthase
MSQAIMPSLAIGPARDLINLLSEGLSPREFAVRYWDGSLDGPDPGHQARFALVLKHPGSLRRMLWPFNKCAVGEAYIYDDIDIEGDIMPFFDVIFHWLKLSTSKTIWQRLGLLRRLLAFPNEGRPHSPHGAQLSGQQRTVDRDRRAIEYHYDGPPSEFYALFLDRFMQYTCAHFARPDEDIDTAQERKLDLICRKLRLKPRERLIDFGCGWGGLMVYAAKHYGVQATGVTISKEQVAWATREFERYGVQDRCRLLFMDYRLVPEDQPYDKAVSVGFIEHLGDKMMPTFFGKVMRLLRPKGLYLHHGITFKPFAKYPPWRAFTLKYVFPDGELVPIPRTVHRLAEAGFEIRDVESLRESYIHTLDRWRRRLEDKRDEAIRLTDEVTYRIYRIYLAGAMRGFQTSLYNLHQTLVVKSGDAPSGLPFTRTDIYRGMGDSEAG